MCVWIASLTAVLALAVSSATAASEGHWFEWRSPDGDLLWSATLDAGAKSRIEATEPIAAADRDAASRALVARPWFPRLPPVAVPIAAADPFPLAQAIGDVLILDFWASWCEPCLKELPAIGRLYESEKENGLRVIIVNMGESARHAERFARGLGLEMPVGLYDAALEDAFNAGSLPTVVVADREGRVRARFDGYRDGLEEEIATLARSLLERGDDEPGERIGEVLAGNGLLKIDWVRNVPGGIDGLAVASLDGPGARSVLVVLGGGHALTYDWRGSVAGFVDRPVGAGALRRGDLDGDGRDELFSFRVGGTRVTRLDLVDGRHEAWDSPAPVLDLALLPAGSGRDPIVAMATVSGLYRAGSDLAAEPVSGFTSPTGLLVVRGPDGPRLGVLGRERGLCTLDPVEPEHAVCHETGEGSRLVAGPSGTGTGIFPRGVAAVGGRFLGGPEGEIALITSTGQLVVVDAASGEDRFRARLEGSRALSAGDFDGDGMDELAVAVGNRIVLFRNPGAQVATPRDDSEKQQNLQSK